MKIKLLAAVCAAVALTLTGCSSTRSIDPVESGSVRVPGTSWQRFCDGPNAVVWIPGYQGEADELEAYIYDHWSCAPEYYKKHPDEVQQKAEKKDEDGISEDEK